MGQRVGQRQDVAVRIVAERGLPAERIGHRGRAIQLVHRRPGLPAEGIGGRHHPARRVHELALHRVERIGRDEEQSLLAACKTMNSAEHKSVGPAMHDRLIGALETCCRQGEMLQIQNRHVDWALHQLMIPGANAKDAENRRIPFDPQGRLAPILKRRATLGPSAFVFGSPDGEFQDSFKTAWESLLLVANGHETKRVRPGVRVDRATLQRIDLHWHDLRHEGARRLLADGVDIRTIQLMLGDSDIKTTQRYLNITDEELRKALTGVWERRRQLRAVGE